MKFPFEHNWLIDFVFKVMIRRGVKKIPQAHIMKRWTRDARDYQYPNELCTSAGTAWSELVVC